VRRRLTVTIVAVVAVCLVLAGAVTIVLTARATREATRRDLVRQAQAVSQGVLSEEVDSATRPRALRLLQALKPLLKLNDVEIFFIGPQGKLHDPVTQQVTTPPPGFTAAQLHLADLQAGSTVSGHRGNLVYAAAPARLTTAAGVPFTQVVLLTRQPASGLRVVGGWFLIAAAISLAAAVIAGDRLSRHFTRPLEEAESVTRRIAGGDLQAHVADPGHAVPELASLAASINSMAEALGRSRGLERQFLLSVSHDLRTPLTSIRGYAEAIADGATTDHQRAALVIASESRRLERLVRDLLDLAKLDARRFSLDLRRVDLADCARATAEGFEPATADDGLTLEIVTPEEVPVTADADRLAQVVANLIENASKFAAHRIVVGTARAAGDLAVLWVDDDGPGIPAEDLPHVFERLYTSSRAPARQVGSGLGLAIVAELVSAMGGSARAESPPVGSGGTRMVVTLRTWSELRDGPASGAATTTAPPFSPSST
jgi:two-component system sensor histidine kinase BaeS